MKYEQLNASINIIVVLTTRVVSERSIYVCMHTYKKEDKHGGKIMTPSYQKIESLDDEQDLKKFPSANYPSRTASVEYTCMHEKVNRESHKNFTTIVACLTLLKNSINLLLGFFLVKIKFSIFLSLKSSSCDLLMGIKCTLKWHSWHCH